MKDALHQIQQETQAILASGSAARKAAHEGGAPSHLSTGWPAIDGCEGSPGLPWRGVHEAFGMHDEATQRLPALSLALHLAWRVVLQAPSRAPFAPLTEAQAVRNSATASTISFERIVFRPFIQTTRAADAKT